MSTPSPQPLDYDLVSPYPPKPERDPFGLPADDLANPRPQGIESDNDAKILDEIEASLRAMIAAEHKAPEPEAPLEEQTSQDEPEALSTDDGAAAAEAFAPVIDQLEAPALADDRLSQEHRYYEAMRVQEVLQQVSLQLTKRGSHEAPALQTEPQQPAKEYRMPPAFLTRAMEPIRLDDPSDEPFDKPWPKPVRQEKRSSAATLFVRFGFAAGGAAAVMIFAVPDLRARFMDAVGTPLATLSSNAAAVFGEGRPVFAKSEQVTTIAVRTEPVVLAKEPAREPDRFATAMPKLATVDISPVMPEQRIAANIGNMPAPQRETVMAPISAQRAAPEQQNRSQAIWHGPAGRAESESATTGLASRPLAAEEIELLRKMAGEFIAAGDYAGARGVLERAAEAGDATSALQLATTYDPAALARFKVKGLAADNAKAAFWYERARDLGSVEAPFRLKAMARNN